ncbi:MAG: hypothetical protein FWJ93_01200 [Micromonosporaceae bacterium]
MEAQRSYPEEPEPRWHGGQRYAQPQYLESEWEGQFEQHPGDHGQLGYDDPPGHGGRFGGSHGSPAGPGGPPIQAGPGSPAGPGGPIGPRSGEPLPPPPPRPGDLPPREPPAVPLPPRGPHAIVTAENPVFEPPRYHAEPIDRVAVPRPPAPVSGSDGIYRARRPGVAAIVGLAVLAFAVPMLLLLRDALGEPVSAGGVIGAVLALLGLPLAGFGLYGLATGAARIPDAPPTHAWLRPPLAYLVVALALFVAAGLAAT